MGIFLISILVLVAGIIFLIIDEHNDYLVLELFGCLFSIFGGIATLSSGIIALTSPDESYFEKRYEDIRSSIDVAANADTVNVRFVSKLEEDINKINDQILNNAIKSNTFWLGWYYSDIIGACDYLVMPEIKNIKYNY